MNAAPICSSFVRIRRAACDFFGHLATAFIEGLSPDLAPSGELSVEEREQIRESVVRILRDLDHLPADFLDQLVDLLRQAFGGVDGFRSTVFAWADLVDELIHDAERHFNGVSRQGPSKKRRVKAALLYLIERSDARVSGVPAFLTPVVWSVSLDLVIDTFVRFNKSANLWTEESPQSVPLRIRVASRVENMVGLFDWLARRTTEVVWRLLFFVTPVSKDMKASVDRFLQVDPKPFRTALVLLKWALEHAGEIASLSDLISVALQEAQKFAAEDDRQRIVFGREIILGFIETETGALPDPGSTGYAVLAAFIDAAIELFAMLLKKHSPREVTSNEGRVANA